MPFMQILDEVSEPFFESYGMSLVTVFRMFADGTLGILYTASDETTETARLYFISFAVLFSLLFAQLLLGIVCNMFGIVKQLDSSQTFSCLNKFFANTNTDVSIHCYCCPTEMQWLQERDLIVEDFLELNKLTLVLHEAIDIMSHRVKNLG